MTRPPITQEAVLRAMARRPEALAALEDAVAGVFVPTGHPAWDNRERRIADAIVELVRWAGAPGDDAAIEREAERESKRRAKKAKGGVGT